MRTRSACAVEYSTTVAFPTTTTETFTADETRALRPYFTNTDRPVFVLRNLPETVKGALFARYSRSAKSVRRLFLEEFAPTLNGVGSKIKDKTWLYHWVRNPKAHFKYSNMPNLRLSEQDGVVSTCDYRLDLPPDLEVKPKTRLSLQVLARRDGVAGAGQVEEDLPLAEPVYVTHLAIDRPLYRPGETVFFRSLTLERFSMRPPE